MPASTTSTYKCVSVRWVLAPACRLQPLSALLSGSNGQTNPCWPVASVFSLHIASAFIHGEVRSALGGGPAGAGWGAVGSSGAGLPPVPPAF